MYTHKFVTSYRNLAKLNNPSQKFIFCLILLTVVVYIRECGSTLYVGSTGIVQSLIKMFVFAILIFLARLEPIQELQ